MVTDQQVRRLFTLMQSEKTLAVAAAKAGMDEKTARKYRRLGKLPSQVKQDHTWRSCSAPLLVKPPVVVVAGTAVDSGSPAPGADAPRCTTGSRT